MRRWGQIMDFVRRAASHYGFALLVCLAVTSDAAAQRIGDVSKAVDNLMVVLREWKGANKQDETLRPLGKLAFQIEGEAVPMELAYYHLLGDMHLRFVFDGPKSFQSATAEEFARFHLSPEQAVERALANIKRVYGEPHTEPYERGLMFVLGGSPDLNSSYFLDRAFWRSQLARHPEGLVAAVPKRDALVFAPASDTEAVDALRDNIAYLHRSSGNVGISSALYLFKDDRWTVFQAPAGR
jgi:uncharacterized protein YtpQ (UPF0354 family)